MQGFLAHWEVLGGVEDRPLKMASLILQKGSENEAFHSALEEVLYFEVPLLHVTMHNNSCLLEFPS